ncbi:UDP-2,4-diacetamido-2,4,6-trideoxy-beta-L-altropyranose hydrolase [Clostridium beijerinckii]|uniref:UDP-2,4-diacetamido-2,4, 6-trideoxy-beta-L-altropyranose hydrolase n=1 Tax=Clostridium beijerinckii TaxID=1520 RepID=UPI00156F27A7|nr:UDP-2,4-diacetamido-2,4,6-trideoxy-beta-L-altropyranose hydrolase [Clostridium beijerinckii]NRT73681.1 UDP-2,4-diacetamido-2,4,6-trideoxy-beta-L-altropyranose hydrolase [Clostridium beijerinckii]
MKIFIRADGGISIGLGHVMRMLVLAKELKKNNEVIFLCKSAKTDKENVNYTINATEQYKNKFKAGIDKIKENGFEVYEIDENNVIQNIIDLQKNSKADLLITDSYDVNEEYFNKLKLHFNLTGYIDDVNKSAMNVDFIINQNINAEDLNYEHNINKDTKLFLGTKYCMLREEFRKHYKRKQVKAKAVDTLLTLGGMDKDYNTIKILNYIATCNTNIHVVIGSAFDDKLTEQIYRTSKSFLNIKVYENANMSDLMKRCDLAISACGSTLYELCAMNVPIIGVILADNQEMVAKKMKEKSLLAEIYYINELEKINLKERLNEILDDEELRNDIINNQCESVNVNGVVSLASEINMMESY